MQIAVLGAGAWGAALALSFAGRHSVTLWTWQAEHAAAMRRDRENAAFLPGFPLPAVIAITDDLSGAIADAELALIATPMAGLRDTAARLAACRPDLPFLWVCKGLEAGTGLLPHQAVAAVHPAARCGALTGPSFADEVARGLPAAITLASADAGFARDMVLTLHGSRLRLYANDDIVGAEVGGAVKNVMAIATGICDGLGLGFNARAALMTRGLAEITRFGVALGARRETFMGLAGMGDLILTCTGDLSRNRRLGLALGKGQSVREAVASIGQVVESIQTCDEVMRLAERFGIDLPISALVRRVLHEEITPQEGLKLLLSREQKPEYPQGLFE